MKIKLKNTSLVSVGGKLPGAEFSVEAHNSQTPKEVFWKNRLADKDGIIILPAAPLTKKKEESKDE